MLVPTATQKLKYIIKKGVDKLNPIVYNKDNKRKGKVKEMNTILIAVIAITIWQLVYTVAVNVTKENDLVMSIIGGGIWLIPIVIINKIFYR